LGRRDPTGEARRRWLPAAQGDTGDGATGVPTQEGKLQRSPRSSFRDPFCSGDVLRESVRE